MLEVDSSVDGTVQDPEDREWLQLAREAFRTSTDYMESSLRKQRETNYASFQSKHAPGSKYYSDAYKFRSKIFRPKIRGAIRRNEAAAAIAYFSTQDAVTTTAENPADEFARMSAELQHELLNYRLEHSIPWFTILIGAYQETQVVGTVCSKQYWDYAEREVEKLMPATDPSTGEPEVGDDGEPVYEIITETKIVRDVPVVRLIPPENIRYDPGASWTDPVNTSPYIIEQIPMYIEDIKTRMRETDPKTGQPRWRQLTDAELLSAGNYTYDSTRQARESTKRQDSKEATSSETPFNIRWVHENIIRRDGQDWVFFTLGTAIMLSDPKPIEEVYLTGKRPFVIGVSQIEAHRLEPTSLAELGFGMNTEANDIVNQRLDNVKLAMNKRFIVRRDANVDFRALTKSVPGGVVMSDDPLQDVRALDTPDVTGSSYHEQDRLSLDFDEVVGAFSPGSVQSNRKLNETVGGMELLAGDANSLSEYQLRVFSESWVEPVLKQLANLERAYETDSAVLIVAGERAQLWAKYRIDAITAEMLATEPNIHVAVGFGATSPQKRIEKLAIGLNTIAQYVPAAMQRVKGDEIITEVFGALGFKGAKRFFEDTAGEDQASPELQQAQAQMQEMQAMVQELQGVIQTKQIEAQTKVQVAELASQTKLQTEQLKVDARNQTEQMKQQLAYINSQIAAEKNQIALGELELQKQALIYQMKLKEVELLRADRDSMAGVLMRDQYGMAPHAEG